MLTGTAMPSSRLQLARGDLRLELRDEGVALLLLLVGLRLGLRLALLLRVLHALLLGHRLEALLLRRLRGLARLLRLRRQARGRGADDQLVAVGTLRHAELRSEE